MSRFRYLNILLFAVILSSCSNSDEELFTGIICETVEYSNKTNLDIWYRNDIDNLDPTPLKPIIIFIHGGGWNSGSRSAWTRDHAHAFITNDILSVSIDYRLAPEAGITDMLTDIDQSIRWIKQNSVRYGGDPDKIFICGHSAGAHLATLYGVKHPSKALGIISIDAGDYLISIPDEMDCSTPYYTSLATAYKIAAGGENPYSLCPMSYIDNQALPSFLLIYQQDEGYRRNANESFYNELKQRNHLVKKIPCSEMDHGIIFIQLGDIQNSTLYHITSFIKSDGRIEE